jgi:hypothetical protein
MKLKLFFLLFFSLMSLVHFGQIDTVGNLQDARVSKLEGESDLRDREFKLLTDQFTADFQSLKADSEDQSMRIWYAIIAGLSFLGISIAGTIKLAKNHAQKLVLDKLEKDLPPMVDHRIEESFERLLKRHSQIILGLVGERDRLEAFKRDKRILALCENPEDCKKMEQLIRMTGFKNVEARIAETFAGADQYDLVVISRENVDHTQYQHLSGQAIWDFLTTLPDHKVVLYYGPRFERLDAEVREKIQFSNIVFTIYARIVEVFEYQHALNNQ